LKILNPNLLNLDSKKVLKIAKDSLINEIIKKNEVKKIFDMSKNHSLTDEYFKNLYTSLNYNNEKDFENVLVSQNNYSIEQIKKKIKVEVLWNDLIFLKYSKQVKIDKNLLNKKINSIDNNLRKEYLYQRLCFKKERRKII